MGFDSLHVRLTRRFSLLLISTALLGCQDATSPRFAQPADDVVIRLQVPAPCLGVCSLTSNELTLGAATIVNSGTATAYLARCGASPALMTQVWQNGAWVSLIGPGLCANASSPSIALAAGDSIEENVWFQVQPTRLALDVSTTPDLAEVQTTASAAVFMFP